MARSISLSLSYSNGNVIWGGQIIGNDDVESISATFTLYKQNSSDGYDYVCSWPRSSSTSYLITSGSTSGSAGTYKLVVYATLTTESGETETVSAQHIKALS
jgi:hypothetical protein